MGLSARWTEEKTRKELATMAAAVAVAASPLREYKQVFLVCGTPQAHIIIHLYLFFYSLVFLLLLLSSSLLSVVWLISALSHSASGVVCIQSTFIVKLHQFFKDLK